MEFTWLCTAVSVLFLTLAFKLLTTWRRRHRNLPPSPPSLPIIGHLHLFKHPLHRTLHRLSQTYGSMFSLRFGTRLVVVLSSPSAVEECFTKNDVVLSNRPEFMLGEYIGYNHTTVTFTPYGDHWRNLRRVAAIEIFSTARLNKFTSIRTDEVRLLLRKLHHLSSREPQGLVRVELKSKLSDMTFNNIMRMIAGKRYFVGDNELEDSEEARQSRELIREIIKYGGVTNAEDFLPILRWIDYKDGKKNLRRLGTKMDSFLQGLIDEHRRDSSSNSMIDHLLSLQQSEPDYYTDQVIKGLMLVMILAGTDTSSVTTEWAMSLLLNHPDVLKKARLEIDDHVGHDRLIEEKDLTKLHYLQNIISETLRLCPAAPLLVPRTPSEDCTIGKYNVPRGTILLVNAWAIHRDPNIWEDPTSYRPERFEGGEAEAHKLLPFGMGRRACPGAGLAQRVVGLALGSLIQCFEWERVSEMEVGLTEGKGLTMPKVVPLEAMCKTRDIVKELFSEDTTKG